MAIYIVGFHMREYLDYYFIHGNMAVSFFFILTGIGLYQYGDSKEGEEKHLLKNISKKKSIGILLPYYLVWGMAFAAFLMFEAHNYGQGDLLNKIILSIPGLFFLDAAGFQSNSFVTGQWYMSAMVLSLIIICPILVKLKNVYTTYISAILGVFILGYINLTFEGIYSGVFSNVGPFTKGFLWGFGAINIGIFCVTLSRLITAKFTIMKNLLEMVILSIIFVYGYICCQYMDGIILLLIAVFFVIELSFDSWLNSICEKGEKLCIFLGKCSLYVYLTGSLSFRIWKCIDISVTDKLLFFVMRVALNIAVALICMFIMQYVRKCVNVE